ncbi:AI-2E family transporter [Halegenticoccus tardaugens]|uniref:AI-2E family transporter n=1 Tax=Halegenticoccus tardaugens TaxID=2071624 RepID=UPI0013E929E7|nr:AI-2E family transporter [Halegenticoccus tardaugens]
MSENPSLTDRIGRGVDGPTVGWWAFAFLLAGVVGFVLYSFVGTAVFGLFVYYVARPVARRIERYVGSSGVAALITILVIVLPFVVVLIAVLAVGLGQLGSVRIADLERYVDPFLPNVDVTALPSDPRELFASFQALSGEPTVQLGIQKALEAGGTFANGLFHGFLVLTFVFFALRDDGRLADWFRGTIADEGTTLHGYLAAVDRQLSTVYFGNMLTVFVVMIVAALLYNGLNLVAPPGVSIPIATLLAVITGLATFVPLVGRSAVYAVVGIYLVFVAIRTDPTTLWFPAVFLAVTIGGLDTLIRYFVRPYLSGRSLHTGLVLFAYLLGAALFGWYGVFLGPLILVVVVEFLRSVFPRLLRGELRDEPARTAPPATTNDRDASTDPGAGFDGASET